MMRAEVKFVVAVCPQISGFQGYVVTEVNEANSK